MTRPFFGVVMSPSPLSSCSVRLTCTVDGPVASPISACVTGISEGLPVHEANGRKAHVDLAKDVRDPSVSITAADIDDPPP